MPKVGECGIYERACREGTCDHRKRVQVQRTYSGRGIHPAHEEADIQVVLPAGGRRDQLLTYMKDVLGLEVMYLPMPADVTGQDLPTYTVGPKGRRGML